MQTQWSNQFTANSDIYTICLIVLHAFTGTSPDRMSIDPITGEISWHDLCIVAGSSAKILNKMITKKPNDQYNSIENVLNDLYQLPMVSILLKCSRTLA